MEDTDIMLPGFRFHPTDEELVGFYLRRKVEHRPSAIELIKQLDIYKYDPWDLPKMGSGEKEWYFLCPRNRKYTNSMRPNRVTGGGFWKATGTDRPIYSSQGAAIGLKKSLVFYKGRAAKGAKTDWMMHEFRLPSAKGHSLLPSKRFMDLTIPANEAWAICRVFKKTSAAAPQRAVAQNWVSFIPPESEPVSNISFSPNSIFFSSPSNTQLDFSSYKPSNTHIAPDKIHVQLSDSHFSASSRRTVVSDYEAYFDDQLGPAPSPEAVLHNNQFSYMPQLIGSDPTAPPQ